MEKDTMFIFIFAIIIINILTAFMIALIFHVLSVPLYVIDLFAYLFIFDFYMSVFFFQMIDCQLSCTYN